MKPTSFRYAAPASASEALRLLAQHGEDARALAGGQSLVPMMNFRLLAPGLVIDLNRVEGWSTIELKEGALAIGAMTRQSAIEDSELVARHCPLLAEAVKSVAHRQIRNRGTIGGSLALAYPGAELPAVVLTLGGTILARSLAAERRIPAPDFFKGALDTALRPDELIAAVRVPLLPASAASAFVEIARRHGDFALAGAAIVLELGRDGAIAAARIGVTGATPIPMRAAAAEASLAGRRLEGAAFAAAADAAAAEVDVLGDPQYPVEYRRSLVAAVVKRGLALATARAGLTRVH